MIDPHAHLRDWDQSKKETVKHGLKMAYRSGIDAVFEMPKHRASAYF
jgi:dihydroorotase